ncbi:hypothetical protein F511_20622 [Dorcoceras hygrometricum]|uniref:Dentin sialophosphoprotein-like n=1 Tax=Dorcoceras hygrometricum TaxID=472368 RepID=A0A2Z7CL77_9LAMI|nr:hypothetical protein F511_20622 [Dorcoceras hygrometricum]
MLQRQIMLKQLQELQRRGQLQELGDARDQNYINPLSQIKQSSGGQFTPTVNVTPVLDSSQMFMVSDVRMMQDGGSDVFPRLPNGLALSQSQNLGVGHVGMSQPQLDMHLYGTHATNSDKNLINYTYLQGPPTNLLSKNNNISLGMRGLHPSTFNNAFLSQQCDFSSDQICRPDGSLLANQFFQEKNLFQQIPVQTISGGNLAGIGPEQGNTAPSNALTLETEGRFEDAGRNGLSARRSSNLGQSSLDPLEQKILYNADDHSWESSFSRSSNLGTGGFTVENTSYMDALSSTQSGSWSALMQSAVADTSSSDTGMQEEWSGLSFQNPGPSLDNQPTNFFDGDRQHNIWVDPHSPNVVSPNFKPENFNQNPYRNCSYPGFQQSDHQHLRQNEEFHSKSSHTSSQISSTYASQLADYSSQLKRLTGVSHLIQKNLPSSNIWPGQYQEQMTSDEHQSHFLLHTNDNQANDDFSGQDLRGTSLLDGSASYPMSDSIRKPFDNVNLVNLSRYSTESEKMVPGHDVEPISAFVSSPGFCSQTSASQSENMLGLVNEDDITDVHAPGVHLNSKVSNPNELSLTETSASTFSVPCNMSPVSQDFDFRPCPTDPWSPQPCSFFPASSMGNPAATSSVCAVKENVKNKYRIPLRINMATNFPQQYSHVKIARSGDPEFPLLDSVPVSHNVGTSSPKTSYHSSLFQSLDSVSSSQENSSEVLNDQPNQNSFNHENNIQESLPCLGKSKDYEQQLENRSSLHQGLIEINNSMPLSNSAGKQEILRKQYFEADAVSGPLVTHTHQQTSNQASHVDKQTLDVHARDMRGLCLNQNLSLHAPINSDTDNGLSLPIRYDNTYYQQAIATARELLSSGHRSCVEDEVKGNLNLVPQLGASFSDKGWNLSPEVQGHLLGKVSSSTHHQNFQQMESVGQNGTQRQSFGSNDMSCVTYGSQNSLQMAPTLFKRYGTFKNEQTLPVCGPNTFNIGKPLTGMTAGNLQESSLMMAVNAANSSQGTYVWPSTDINLNERKQLSSPIVLPSDAIPQNLLVSMPKKRKHVAFTMVSWHKEVSHESSRLQDISMAELEWAQASKRRLEEVKNDVEIIEDGFPLIPPKRRLIFTTQLMQKVFKPAPAAILCADASSNYDCVVYTAARLALGDVCGLIGQFSSETNILSPDQQKTSTKANGCGVTEIVEGLFCRVNKLDGDLSRLHKNSLFADIKVENQELEKISIINRFAKFHIKAQLNTTDPTTSSSKSIVQRTNIERYVMALPMPKTVPEGINCLSL